MKNRLARVVLALAMPLMLAIGLIHTEIIPVARTYAAGLTITPLDSSLHVQWTPTSDPNAQWQVLIIKETDGTVQQSKVLSKTANVAQANGLVPGRTYNIEVHSMNAAGTLTLIGDSTAATDPQSPMQNAAFFENFNGTGSSHGPLDPNYFDVRTEGCAFDDITDNRSAFNNENHWHTLLSCGGNVGGIKVRPRTQFDFTGRTGTIQFEADIAPVQHSHGKWWSVHLTRDLASLPSSFGSATGDGFPNSIEFGIYGGANARSTEYFNIPFIAVNTNGSVQRFEAQPPGFMTPTNVRVPIVIKVNRTSAELFINGVSAVRATGLNLAYERAWMYLGHKNYGAEKVDWDQNPPTIYQLVHWETLQFDGPGGSYSPLIKTFIQPGCDGSVDDGHNSLVGCDAFVDYRRSTNSFTFTLGPEEAQARSVRLLTNGGDPSTFTVTLNGNSQQLTLQNTQGGIYEQLNSWLLNPAWLVQGTNTLTINASTNNFGLAQVELEVVFDQPRTLPTPAPSSHQMINLTANNFRVEKIPSDPNLLTQTTYIYSQGAAGDVAFQATVLKGAGWLTISPSTGIVRSPATGGGVQPLTVSINFAGISESAEGLIRVDGGAMPSFIGIYAVRTDQRSTFTQIDSSRWITTFNKAAIPDYHGSGNPTPTIAPSATRTPTSGVVPTGTPTFGPSATRTPTTLLTSTSTRTTTSSVPTSTSTSTRTPTPVPPTNTPTPASGTSSVVYADALQHGWQNWSWGTTVDLASTAYVRSGTRSLSARYNAQWAGLQLGHDGFNTRGYNRLTFWINGGSNSGQQIDFYMADIDGNSLGSANLDQYISGGRIEQNTWLQVSIPLSDFKAMNNVLSAIVLQDLTGGAQPAFYLDDIQFEGD